jgi:hypothetical protein
MLSHSSVWAALLLRTAAATLYQKRGSRTISPFLTTNLSTTRRHTGNSSYAAAGPKAQHFEKGASLKLISRILRALLATALYIVAVARAARAPAPYRFTTIDALPANNFC